jgi:acyl-CoA reductase-like NAD-dependent aldehyde dehydrogenase
MLVEAVKGLVGHPKMGAGTLGGIQNDQTLRRIHESGDFGGTMLLQGTSVQNPEFEHARTMSPSIIALNAADRHTWSDECFGPLIFIIKTKDTNESLHLAAELAAEKGAITCLAFSSNTDTMHQIADEMNRRFVPVSFNLGGAAFVNQHAAFSDFHVSGGNPAGNASFTNPEYVTKRFVWVGNRYMKP